MTENGELTQPKLRENWVVKVDRNTFVLNEDEVKILKEADKAGHRGIIWFKDFAISVPHISCVYLDSKEIDESKLLPPPSSKMTDEDIKNWEKFKNCSKNSLAGGLDK